MWQERTADEVGRLRQRAADAIAARSRLARAIREARDLIHPVPAALSGTAPDGVDLSKATSAWRDWDALTRESDALVLADGLEHLEPVLTESAGDIRDRAVKLLQNIEDVWRPIAGRLQVWMDLHKRAQAAQSHYRDVSSALTWTKTQAEQLRDERLAPFSEQSARIWAELRQESNVDLGPIAFAGSGRTRRKLAVPVRIIVLTHDDRLADALRRLMLPTTILEVTRREGSQVEIVPNQDPVRRYLDDARQIARTTLLPDDLAAITVAGCCRDAVEVACQRTARRRLHTEGVSVAEVDERLVHARTTMNRVAVALFGEGRRTAQVMPTLNRLADGRWAADVLHEIREGTHQPRGDLDHIIRDSERLCDLILATSSS